LDGYTKDSTVHIHLLVTEVKYDYWIMNTLLKFTAFEVGHIILNIKSGSVPKPG